jgi:hypothetical protein
VLVAALALALSLTFGGSAPAAPAPRASISQLPPTQPGLSHDEGTFLVTSADDGSRAVYFIANNSRHSILWTDLQIELQLNPLWPVFDATTDQVLAFPEGAPIGGAPSGLLGGAPEDAEPAAVPTPPADDDTPSTPASADEDQTDIAQANTYILRRGDNLTRIAAQFGTSIDAILAANAITNPNRVYVGQVLIIPSADA